MSTFHCSLFLLMIASIPLCAARAVLSHGNSPTTPLSLILTNNSHITASPDSPAEKQGHTLAETLITSLTFGLLLYLIFGLALVVMRHHNIELRPNIRPALQKLGCVSRAFRPSASPKHDSMLPLIRDPVLSADAERTPSSVAFPGVHPGVHEPIHSPHGSPRSLNVLDTDHDNQYFEVSDNALSADAERTPSSMAFPGAHPDVHEPIHSPHGSPRSLNVSDADHDNQYFEVSDNALSADAERTPSSVVFPGVHPDVHEPIHSPFRSPRSSNASDADRDSQYSLQISESSTSTVVLEPLPRRGFF